MQRDGVVFVLQAIFLSPTIKPIHDTEDAMNLRANACIIIKMALLWCLMLIPTAAKAEVAVAARLTAQDKIDLKRVEDYLESLSTLKSRFLQTSSNGRVASGKLYVPAGQTAFRI